MEIGNAPDWLGWAIIFTIFLLLVVIFGVRVGARIWHSEKRRHLLRLLSGNKEELTKETEDELEG